jgi:hypothetical protein
MTPRRRDEEDDSETQEFAGEPALAAIAPASRGAWNLFLLIAAIISGIIAVAILDANRATAIAKEIVEVRVGPVETQLHDHLTEMKGKTDMMQLWVKQYQDQLSKQQESLDKLNVKLDALCRASARPAVCLGGS